ncbi:MAG: alpha/beta hydrolase [Rufibacter sp.]
MKKAFLPLLFLFLFNFSNVYSQGFTTLTYYQDDTLKLELDLFLPKTAGSQKLPLVIFEHGGGFSGGDRTAGHAFSRFLASRGYAAATISYTLYMKGKNYGCTGQLVEKIKTWQIAANQMWLATAFFLQNAEKHNINTGKIFLAGSSAGAEAALQAAFWDRQKMNLYPKVTLPASFKYAGVVSGAGAIMDLNLITAKNLMPVLLFHGSEDRGVPYATGAHHDCPPNSSNWFMLFGSLPIYQHVVGLNGNTRLITFCGGAHEYSGELFNKNQGLLVDFLDNVVEGKKAQEHIIISTGKKSTYPFCE